MVDSSPGDDPALQGVVSLFASDSKLEVGRGIRFVDGDSGTNGRRFLDEQCKLGS